MSTQECARFPEFWQNFSECQILWSLRSVDFHTLTLQLPIQTSLFGASELQVFVSSLQNSKFQQNEDTPERQLQWQRQHYQLDFIITN